MIKFIYIILCFFVLSCSTKEKDKTENEALKNKSLQNAIKFRFKLSELNCETRIKSADDEVYFLCYRVSEGEKYKDCSVNNPIKFNTDKSLGENNVEDVVIDDYRLAKNKSVYYSFMLLENGNKKLGKIIDKCTEIVREKFDKNPNVSTSIISTIADEFETILTKVGGDKNDILGGFTLEVIRKNDENIYTKWTNNSRYTRIEQTEDRNTLKIYFPQDNRSDKVEKIYNGIFQVTKEESHD